MEPVTPIEPKTIKRIVAETPIKTARARVRNGARHFIEPYWLQEILPGHLHSHNIYISWLVWGGIFTLTSGLIFIFAPVIVVLVRRNLRTNIAVLLVALLWAASMLFDSFLVHKQFNYVFILLACMSNSTISLNRND